MVFAVQSAGEKTQLKGRIRRSLALDAFPRQPHCGLAQEIFSPPNSSIASSSESEALEHFRCRVMSCPPLGQTKTNRYALFINNYTTIGDFGLRNMPTGRKRRRPLQAELPPNFNLPRNAVLGSCGHLPGSLP